MYLLSIMPKLRKFQLRNKWNALVCVVLLRAVTEVSVGEVMNYFLNRQDTLKADGSDGIPAWLLSNAAPKLPSEFVCNLQPSTLHWSNS